MDKRRINVRAIIWHDNKLLAVKHRNKDGSESDYWAVPGGGLDPMEALEDGVKREIMEETGVEAKIGKLVLIQQFRSSREHRDEELELLFTVANGQDFTALDLSKTSHGLEEIARIEFIDPKTAYIMPKILSELDLATLVTNDSAVVITSEL